MKAAEFAELLEARPVGETWMARCPAHADSDPSLKIAQGDQGVLIHCWAGCRKEDILKAMGLEWGDLFDKTLDEEDAKWNKINRKVKKERETDRYWERAGYDD